MPYYKENINNGFQALIKVLVGSKSSILKKMPQVLASFLDNSDRWNFEFRFSAKSPKIFM